MPFLSKCKNFVDLNSHQKYCFKFVRYKVEVICKLEKVFSAFLFKRVLLINSNCKNSLLPIKFFYFIFGIKMKYFKVKTFLF